MPESVSTTSTVVSSRPSGIGILGTGSYLPKDVVSNDDLRGLVRDVTPEWIERKTLIRERRWATPREATSDLAVQAAEKAMAQAGVGADDLGYVIVSTSTGDSPLPPTACLVQDAIGAYDAACFDVNTACAGFVYGLELARSLVATRPGAHALVVAADVYSRILDLTDRRTAVLLGDGAGAAVVGAVPASYGVIDADLAARGDAHGLIWVEAGGSRVPPSAETVRDGGHFLRMNGRGVREFVLDNVPPMLAGLLARTGTSGRDVDHFFPHQANGVLLGELVDKCDLPRARTHLTLEKYGNVGSASIPIALDEAHRAGSLRDGELVLLAGFGAGMSMGSCLLRWTNAAGVVPSDP
jgi:acetoacetyl-CoA synthase